MSASIGGKENRCKGASTQAVHGGAERDKGFHSMTTPIVQTATYTFDNTAKVIEFLEKRYMVATSTVRNTPAMAILRCGRWSGGSPIWNAPRMLSSIRRACLR